MNIAMITNSYKPFVGGVPISVERLAAGLRARGHGVTIFAPHYPGEQPEDGVIRFRTRRKTLGDEMAVPDMFDPLVGRAFRAMNFDLIHVHQPMLAGYMGLRLARRHRVPLVMTCHTKYEEYLHYLKPLAGASRDSRLLQTGRRAVGLHNRLIMDRCDLVLAPTPTMAAHLERQGLRVPVDILPTGLEAADFQVPADAAGALRRRYLPKSGRLFCTVSRLSREKNQAFLLRALAAYKREEGENFHLLVIGDGPERSALTTLRDALGLGEQVTFVGAVPHDELTAWYGAADLFLFSSLSETQGIVLLEAMAAGLPVVALEATGANDVVRDRINGRLCPVREGAFVRALADSAALDANLARMSHEAGVTARHYRADRVAAAAEAFYCAMLAPGGVVAPGSGQEQFVF